MQVILTTAAKLLQALGPAIAEEVVALLQTLLNTPEDERLRVAKRAVQAAAGKAASEALVEEALKRG
jgi:hypothetical protein